MNSTTGSRKYILLPALLCCMLLQLCWPSEVPAGTASLFHTDSEALKALGPDFTADDSFSSHLPLLVFELTEKHAAAEGLPVKLTIFDAPSGSNTLLDRSKLSVNVLMHEEPGQEAPGKKSYTLELVPVAEFAHLQKAALAGLPEDSQWRLQGSTRDKGMLRNGLAYAFGRTLFPAYTPQTRYCEVLVKKNGQYHYEGIYILAQSMDQMFRDKAAGGDDGIMLAYSPAKDKTRDAAPRTAGDEAVYGWSLHDRGFSMAYPRDGDDANQEARIEMDIDKMESVLHSLQPGTFLNYSSLLDQRSAIDLYILNSLLLNAHESTVPLFIHKEAEGKLRFLPVWNFDAAIDNVSVRRRPLPYEQDALDISPPSILSRRLPVWRQLENGGDIRDLRHYPVYRIMDGDHFLWFDRLFLSRPFLMELYSRYHELRRGPLSPGKVGASVDELAASLGQALIRDWSRWEKEYTESEGPFALAPYTDDKGESHIRQTYSYDQELVRMRYSLQEQDTFLMAQLAQIDWISADLFDESTSGNRQAAYALGTIIAFLFLTYMLTRKL